MAPRKKAKQVDLFVNHLLEAVKFVSHAQHGKGDEMATHCAIRYGHIIAFDRTLAAGCPITEDDLNCCPQTERLRLALERCGEEHQIVQQASDLYVRSGEFSGYVPLCDPQKITMAIPDPNVAPLGDTFRAALKVVGALVKDSAPTVLQSCVQVNSGSVSATNGTVILEAWHGWDMPPGLLLPKAFVDALVRIRKPLQSFGFSPATFTVHFEDRSWLRTNLYKEKIPNMLAKLVPPTNQHPFPVGFFDRVAEIAHWSEDGRVYVDNFAISSHAHDQVRKGSELSFPMPQLLQGVSYSIGAIKQIAKVATHFDDRVAKGATMIFGNGVRGAIAHEEIKVVERPKELGYCGEITGVCEGKCDGTCLDIYRESKRMRPCPECKLDFGHLYSCSIGHSEDANIAF